MNELCHAGHSEVWPNLFIGGTPFTGELWINAGISALVLCAHQESESLFPGVRVIYCPLTDDAFRIVDGDLGLCLKNLS